MNTEVIKASWEDLAGRRVEFIEAFYARLFERHPQYRKLFPEQMGAQVERMIEMAGALAQLIESEPTRRRMADAMQALKRQIPGWDQIAVMTTAAYSGAHDPAPATDFQGQHADAG